MRITESKLREIIRSVIAEDFDYYADEIEQQPEVDEDENEDEDETGYKELSPAEKADLYAWAQSRAQGMKFKK